MTDDEDEVGYKKPPRKNRFKKGQSGNPAGRPRKQKPDGDLRSIIERISNEEVCIAGQTLTLRELELRSLQHKAAKGDVPASKHLMKLREQAGCDKPKREGSVLVVPGTMPFDEWSAAAAIQQAKFREQGTDEDDD